MGGVGTSAWNGQLFHCFRIEVNLNGDDGTVAGPVGHGGIFPIVGNVHHAIQHAVAEVVRGSQPYSLSWLSLDDLVVEDPVIVRVNLLCAVLDP